MKIRTAIIGLATVFTTACSSSGVRPEQAPRPADKGVKIEMSQVKTADMMSSEISLRISVRGITDNGEDNVYFQNQVKEGIHNFWVGTRASTFFDDRPVQVCNALASKLKNSYNWSNVRIDNLKYDVSGIGTYLSTPGFASCGR